MRFSQLFAVFALSALAGTAVPRQAAAAAGSCKCNNGCHSSPGQCFTGVKASDNKCSLGYESSCGTRPGCSSSAVSCSGVCTCTPIPGFCDTIGGAEFCDAGPEPTPDTSVPDTFVEDTFVPDTFVPPPDTFVPDTFVPDTFVPDTFVPDTFMPDTFVPDTFMPDTFVEDTFVPPDTEPPPDTFVPPMDTCAPLACPPGLKTIPVPGECDPFCAQPCGTGEFKCSGLTGTECKEGFCVPKCLITPCKECQSCGGDGVCFDDPTKCAGDGGVGDGSTTTDGAVSDGSGGDGGPVEDGTVADGSSEDGTVGDGSTTGDGSTGSDTADPFGEPENPAADTATQGGCGCSTPGTSTEGALAAMSAAALAMVIARRRRK